MEQLLLFPSPDQQTTQTQPTPKKVLFFNQIRGLEYIENYIDEIQHDWLLTRIDKYHKHQWLDDLKRRVQHYGFKYDYKARRVDIGMHIGELPKWLKKLSQKLHKDEHMPEVA
ncbi:MAG: hypothetical protein OXH57_06495, partial [Ekhidna sp.]|nr:hypothetical protein [Ekhidna sp.]